MMQTELFIYHNNAWRAIELSEDVPFPIIYSIADVRDISKRNSSHTKTIRIPGTDNNHNLLDHIFDVANNATFNPNISVKAYVLSDTVPVFSGTLQLRNILTKNNNYSEYECIIYGDNDALVKNMGQKELDDLNLSLLNHDYTESNIVNSWTRDWTNGYFYPLVDYGNFGSRYKMQNKGVGIEEMRPAIYTKWLLDRIISEAGFYYQSDFLDSDFFKNTIIPHSELNLLSDKQWVHTNSFRVGMTGDQEIFHPTTVYVSTNLQNPNNASGLFRTTRRIFLNDTTTFPFGDPSNKWDNTLYQFEEDLEKTQTFYLDLDITYANKWSAGVLFPSILDIVGSSHRVELRVKRSLNPLTLLPEPNGYCVELEDTPTSISYSDVNDPANRRVYILAGMEFLPANDPEGANNPLILPIFAEDPNPSTGFKRYSGQLYITFDDSTPEKRRLRPGENLWVEVVLHQLRGQINPIISDPIKPLVINDTTQLYNIPSEIAVPGSTLSGVSFVKPKVKQIDFFTSIIKLFNLFVVPDRFDERLLIIEPRDGYYNLGVDRDWSHKLDISNDIKQDVIAELQARKLRFTYKDDEDYLNGVYTNRWTETYGEYEFDTGNEFTKGTDDVEVIFAPTVQTVVPGMPNLIIPSIIPEDINDKKFTGDIRILSRRMVNLPPGSQWKLNGVDRFDYPYSGHFDHPTQGQTDLNFGITKELFYPGNTITNNNLFNLFYRNMLDELTGKDSRLVHAHFYLDQNDINSLSFNDRIFVDRLSSGTGNWFRINKVEFDPVRTGSYKVELLKITQTVSLYEKEVVNSNTTTGPRTENTFTSGGKRPIDYTSIDLGGNGKKPTIGIVAGTKNNISSSGTGIVLGDGNYVAPDADQYFIQGKNNQVGHKSNNVVIIGGENNSIAPGVNNAVIIGGNGIVNNQSDTVMIGGTLLSGTNFLSAGRDEVLNKYPTGKVINFVSAGRDDIREFGSHSIESRISGGEDRVL